MSAVLLPVHMVLRPAPFLPTGTWIEEARVSLYLKRKYRSRRTDAAAPLLVLIYHLDKLNQPFPPWADAKNHLGLASREGLISARNLAIERGLIKPRLTTPLREQPRDTLDVHGTLRVVYIASPELKAVVEGRLVLPRPAPLRRKRRT